VANKDREIERLEAKVEELEAKIKSLTIEIEHQTCLKRVAYAELVGVVPSDDDDLD